MFGRKQFQRLYEFTILRNPLLACLALSPAATLAQWTPVAPNLLGPIDIETGSITTKSGIIWAGTHDLWMSSDFGTTWAKRSPGLVDRLDRIKAIHFYDDKIGALVSHYGYIFL